MKASEYWEKMEQDLDFQLRVAEEVKTSNISIAREYGYLLLFLVRDKIQKLKAEETNNV